MTRKIGKDGPGAAMKRMAEITAKLTAIDRNEKLKFTQRAAKAAPLRKELAELEQKLWGGNGSA